MILAIIAEEDTYGYEIASKIARRTKDAVQLNAGAAVGRTSYRTATPSTAVPSIPPSAFSYLNGERIRTEGKF